MLFFLVLLGFSFQSEAIFSDCPYNDPVCGVDGKTYKNICELNTAKSSDPDLQVLYDGPCVEQRLLGLPQLTYKHLRPMRKPNLTQNSKYNPKKYLLHFRTFAKQPSSFSILDDCSGECVSVCPRNKERVNNALYITKLCMDCCRGSKLFNGK